MNSPPRIAISLGASFLGFATHAGFLARLHALGVRPVAVGGSSAGAVAAGLYAAGLSQEAIHDTVCSDRFRRSFVRRTPWWTHHLRNTFRERNVSLFKPDGAVHFLESVLGHREVQDLRAPSFLAAVSDLNLAQSRFLTEGSLARAMVASCCVPAIFAPLEHAGIQCHDGGVAHEAPVDPWLDDPGVDLIIVHRIAHTPYTPPRFFPFNMLHLTGQAHACVSAQLLDYRCRIAALNGKKLIVTTTQHDRPPVMTSKRMPEFYALGEEMAQQFYEKELRALVGGAPS